MPTLSDSEGMGRQSKCKIVGMQIPEYDPFNQEESAVVASMNNYMRIKLLSATLTKRKFVLKLKGSSCTDTLFSLHIIVVIKQD
jgi:hypothetical protein